MNILILSASHPYKMAGIVAYDLYKGFKNNPENKVKLLVKTYDKFEDSNIISIQSDFDYLLFRIKTRFANEWLKITGKKTDIINKTDPDYCFFDIDETKTFFSTKRILKRVKFKPDVVLVLFMTSFVSYKNLYEINKTTKAPIFVYMMDMAPITGGCHYAWDCKGYMENCGNCPGLYSKKYNDNTFQNFNFKKTYIDKTNIIAISCTEHQNKQLFESSLFKSKEKRKILLGINQEVFKPGSKAISRSFFNLPLNKKIILCGSISVTEKRKGFNEFILALNELKNINPFIDVHILIAGNINDSNSIDLPYEFTFLGRLDHVQLASAFQAVDFFVSPSIEDSGPMMINQSIMCGTPVVAFEMGVANDLVESFKTGYKAKINDVFDFAYGLNYLLTLTDNEYITLTDNCKSVANEHLRAELQINQFLNLFYESIN